MLLHARNIVRGVGFRRAPRRGICPDGRAGQRTCRLYRLLVKAICSPEKYSTVNGRRVMSGHLYAEFQIPSRQTHPWPIVMIHGGSQSGTNFTEYARRPRGLGPILLATRLRGVRGGSARTRPSRLRSRRYGRASQLDPDSTQKRFVAPERYNLWPQAHLHTQWPGPGTIGDPCLRSVFASQLPSIQDFALQQQLNRDAILALLDKIGPAILLTHSQSGAFGWPVADTRPDLVKAIVAVEPNAPTVLRRREYSSTRMVPRCRRPDQHLGFRLFRSRIHHRP